jgi:hypothetical protein
MRFRPIPKPLDIIEIADLPASADGQNGGSSE